VLVRSDPRDIPRIITLVPRDLPQDVRISGGPQVTISSPFPWPPVCSLAGHSPFAGYRRVLMSARR